MDSQQDDLIFEIWCFIKFQIFALISLLIMITPFFSFIVYDLL